MYNIFGKNKELIHNFAGFFICKSLNNEIMVNKREEECLAELSKEVFNNVEVKMLRLAMSPSVDQGELDSSLAGWNIEQASVQSQGPSAPEHLPAQVAEDDFPYFVRAAQL